MKRDVIKVTNYVHRNANGTKGRNILYLACGHFTSRKGSLPVPKRADCRECTQMASGLSGGGSWADGSIVESWDAEKQMPVFTDNRDGTPRTMTPEEFQKFTLDVSE